MVIFCGGKGTRLKEETDFKPKPMVTIGGLPILWHIMKIYSARGFNNFILCLGYRGDTIRDFFLNHHFHNQDCLLDSQNKKIEHLGSGPENWKIIFAETGAEALTGERLFRITKYLSGDRFMVTYGDGVTDMNISDLLDYHLSQKTIGTITGVHPYSKWGLAEIDGASRIKRFRQKPLLDEYVNGGFMVFERPFIKYLEEGISIEEAFSKLIRKKQLSLYKYNGFWHAMDTYQDHEELNRLWQKKKPWQVWKES